MWQLTCASLSGLLAIVWTMDKLIFRWRHWSVTYFLMNFFASIYHSIWRPPTILPTYCHLCFSIPILWCSLTKMHTQKCGNFEKIMMIISSHVKYLYLGFRTCLNNVNAIMYVTLWMWHLPKCRFNTKDNIIHLCWNKQFMYAVIIYCICSLQS